MAKVTSHFTAMQLN